MFLRTLLSDLTQSSYRKETISFRLLRIRIVKQHNLSVKRVASAAATPLFPLLFPTKLAPSGDVPIVLF